MENGARSADLRTQKTQKALLKATFAMAKICNQFVTSTSPETRKLIPDLTDAVGLVLKANQELSMERRNKILNAPQINKKYWRLASADIPVTENLFASDLKDACAKIDSTSKLGTNLIQSVKGRNFFRGQKTGTGNRHCTGVKAKIGISREADQEVCFEGAGQGPQPPSAVKGLGSVAPHTNVTFIL